MSSKLKVIAKEQRDNPTTAESNLWELIRRGQLDGHKFRRKHVFRGFIVDFACLERHVVIEIETGSEDLESVEEKKKDQWLNSRKYIVLRFKEAELVRDPRGVIPTIERSLKGLPPVEADVVFREKVETTKVIPEKKTTKAKPTKKAVEPKEDKEESAVSDKKTAAKTSSKATESKEKAEGSPKVKSKPNSKEPLAEEQPVAAKETKALEKTVEIKHETEKTSVEKPVETKAAKIPEKSVESSQKVAKVKEPALKLETKSVSISTPVESKNKKTEDLPEAKAIKEPELSPKVIATDTDKLFEQLNAGDSLSGMTVGDVDFSGKEIKNIANFSGVIFSGQAVFRGTSFLNGADFSDAQFTGNCGSDFSNASFIGDGSVDFVDTFFSKENLTIFSSVKTENPKKVRFENVFLGRTSFLNTDVSQFRFKNVQFCELPIGQEEWFGFFSFLKKNVFGVKTWSEFKAQVKSFLPIVLSLEPVKRIGLVDEVWNEVANNGQTRQMDTNYFKQVNQLYKQLRKNFQRNKNYSLTVDMRCGEYETSRK
jgi:very-short-patch-repair endonuclease